MGTMATSDGMFIDTNVFVYARFPASPWHSDALALLESVSFDNELRCISRQIIREYLASVSRPMPWADALSRQFALDDVKLMVSNHTMLEDGPAVTRRLIQICRQTPVGGRQVHDANIVATMLAHGERRLLTFNVAHFRRFSDQIDIFSA